MSKQQSELISIIIPAFNEAENIPVIHAALQAITGTLLEFNFEFVYVDDGSQDGTSLTIEALQTVDARVQLVTLVRNFGKEIATTAGLHHCKGAAALIIDADLQHPPELIPEFIARWQAGDDVVVGRQQLSADYASFTKRATARWYYHFMNRISVVPIMPHATDYRLLDRAVIDEFTRLTEHNRMTRGLIDWLGFTPSYIDFTPIKRLHGQRTYSYRKLFKLAMDSIVSLSFFPLRLAGYLGAVIVVAATPLLTFIGFDKFFNHNHFNISGSAILAAFVMLLVGVVLICQGLMALYIANIYHEVQNRPLYIEKRPRAKRQ